MVIELAEHGDLMRQLQLRKGRPFKENWLWRILIGLLRALDHTHRFRLIIHNDIKPANVLIGKGCVPKLADFGCAQQFVEGATVIGGSRLFMSPEALREEPITPASDIFATGTTMYLFMTGYFPFQNTNEIMDPDFHPAALPARYSFLLREVVVASMLNKDAKLRPSA